MRNRWLAVAIATTLLSACGGTDPAPSATGPAPTASAPTSEPAPTTGATTGATTEPATETTTAATAPLTTAPTTVTTAPTTSPTTSPNGPDGTGGVVASQLAGVPASARTPGEPLDVQVTDVVAAAELVGVDPPAAGRASDDIARWMLAWEMLDDPDAGASVPAPLLLGNARVWQSADLVLADTGIDIGAIDAVAAAFAPPMQFTVTTGDIALDTGVLADLGGGVWSAGEGDDYSVDMEAAGGWRQVGQPVRFAERDGTIAWSTSTPLTQDWLGGPVESLADVPDYAAAAAALDARDVVSAYFSENDFGAAAALSPTASPQDLERFTDALPDIAPFSLVAVAISPDGPVAAYVFADAAAASAAAEPIAALWRGGTSAATNQPFADLVTVAAATAEDRVVVIELEPTSTAGRTLLDFLVRREVLFIHP